LKAFRGRVALTAAFAEMDIVIVNTNRMHIVALPYKCADQIYDFRSRAVSDGTAIDYKDIHIVLLDQVLFYNILFTPLGVVQHQYKPIKIIYGP